MAGSAMILPECRSLWDGVERADSWTTDAHKWLNVPYDCGLVFVRDGAAHRAATDLASAAQAARALRAQGAPVVIMGAPPAR